MGDSPASKFFITTFRNTLSFTFVSGVIPAYTVYKDGRDRAFRNVGI